jgi:hypothetical protein
MTEPISDTKNLRSRIGEVIDVRGQYDIWDMGPHKVMVDLPDGRVKAVRKIVNLLLDDGSTVRLWVRPDTEMKMFSGCTVVVSGKPYASNPPLAPSSVPGEALSLLEVERIILA